mmetsp:Transcript_37021/g.116356  ORF Transcript_37021/g.116356 Transcript_37021/m.116356 type:complete len:251 (-) Transcript_37021:1978-2730(-)
MRRLRRNGKEERENMYADAHRHVYFDAHEPLTRLASAAPRCREAVHSRTLISVASLDADEVRATGLAGSISIRQHPRELTAPPPCALQYTPRTQHQQTTPCSSPPLSRSRPRGTGDSPCAHRRANEPAATARASEPRCGPHAPSSVANVTSSAFCATTSPAAACSTSTVASAAATSVCSIFIASSTATASPGATRWPGATSSCTSLPGIGATIGRCTAPASAAAASAARAAAWVGTSETETRSCSPPTNK